MMINEGAMMAGIICLALSLLRLTIVVAQLEMSDERKPLLAV
jgi:hypothetical protein